MSYAVSKLTAAALLIAAVLVTGCVSTADYQALKDEVQSARIEANAARQDAAANSARLDKAGF